MFGLAPRIRSLHLAPVRLGIALAFISTSICAADEAFVRQQQAIKRIDGYIEHYRRTGDSASRVLDLEEADAELATSYEEFNRRGNLEAASLSLIKRGDISRYRGLNDGQQSDHWQRAIHFYQQARALAQHANHRPHQAEALTRLAQAEAGRRNYGAAAAHIEEALRLSATIDDKRYLSNSLDQLAFIQSHAGDLVAAADTRNRALAVAEAMQDDLRRFYGYDGRAGVYEDLSERSCDYRWTWKGCADALHRAQKDYERALELAKQLGSDGLVNMTEESLRRVEQRREVAKQRQKLMQGLESKDFPSVGFHPRTPAQVLVHQRFTLGPLDLPAEEEVMPADVVEQTRDFLKFAPGEAYAWRFHLEGSLLEAQGDHDAALAAYLKAVEVLEADRSTLRTEQSRGTFLEGKISFYYRPLLHRLERRQLGEAFELLERSRSRALADLLESTPLTPARSTDHERYAELRQIEGDIALCQRELFNWKLSGKRVPVDPKDPKCPAESIAEIEQEIQDLEDKRRRLLKEAPMLQELTVAPLESLASLQQLQHSMRQEGYEVLQYLALESNLIVWHISGDAVQVKSVFLPRSELIKKVKHLRDSVSNRHRLFAEHEQTARELFLFLIQPMLSRIGSKHLVIIPHDALYYIPFQVLQDPLGTYLGERFRISYAPSATILLRLRQAGSLAGGKLLAVADPILAWAPQEVAAIARWYADRHTVIGDALVTEAALKAKARGAEYDLLHLAVHGWFSEQAPLLSYLQLAKGGQDDGNLTAAEMFGLSLEGVRLAVLSACNTGRAEATHANEVLGMIRALLYAGANTLMLSSWEVESASTARWMEEFYKAAQTQSVSEAARLALTIVKNDPEHPEYRHPYYWGPFVMIGK